MVKAPNRKYFGGIACALGVLLAPVAQGNEAGDAAAPSGLQATSGLEEVIVTARKRAENSQVTPISLTALTLAALEESGSRSLNDIGQLAPNLLATAGQVSNTDANFFIRGIGQYDYFASVDPGVGTYLDGVYLGRVTGANLDLADVERIEVLRGPQGTLFGRNTIGGAVSIVTADPGNDLAVKLKGSFGQRRLRAGQASIDLPLVANELWSKLTLGVRKQDGWVTQALSGSRFFDIDDLVARLNIIWKPFDGLKFRLAGDYTRGRGTAPAVLPLAFNFADTSPFGVPLPAGMAGAISSNRYVSYASQDPIQNIDAHGISLTVDAALTESVSVKSISAYRTVKQLLGLDNDGTQYVFYDLLAPTDQSQWSQELQVLGNSFSQKLKWIAGLYYFHERVDQTNGITLGGSPLPMVAPGVVYHQNILPRNQSEAGFAQATWNFTTKLSGTLGLRFNHESKSMTYNFIVDNTTGYSPFFPPTSFRLFPLTTVSNSWNSFTPKIGLEYQINPQTLYYVSYSEGFRSGGFNGRPTSLQAITPYSPEKAHVTEVGVKTELADRKLRVNADVWYNRYTNLQLTNFSGGFITVDNAGAARLYGSEIEITAVPVEPARIFVNVGYLRSRYTQLAPGAGGGSITLGTPLPYNPEWNVTAGGEYRLPLGGSAGSLNLHADYSYIAQFWFNPAARPLDHQGGYGLTNARISWQSTNRNFEIAAYGKNVFNKHYSLDRFDLLDKGDVGIATYYPSAPAEFGGEIIARF